MTHHFIHGGKVICGVSADNQAEVIEDGAVEIKNGKILRIGPASELLDSVNPDKILGGSNQVVFPGFVNAHHHVGVTPLQLGAPDLPLELWIIHRIGGQAVPLYLDTLYSAFELIRSGVTTVQHLQGRVPVPASNIYEKSHEVLRAYRDIGMRASYSLAQFTNRMH